MLNKLGCPREDSIMTNVFQKLQCWYRIHCNGDWEHQSGIKIGNLDNPGWTIEIDLIGTILENAIFEEEYDNSSDELDWYKFKIENQVLNIWCGASNLDQVLGMFFETIIPAHSDKDFIFEVYLPVPNHPGKLWTLALAKYQRDCTVTLVDIPPLSRETIRMDYLDNTTEFGPNLPLGIADPKLTVEYKVGDEIDLALQYTCMGLIRVPK